MRIGFLAAAFVMAIASGAEAQQCLHGDGEAPEAAARRREALMAARVVNTAQWNQPGARSGRFLSHDELAGRSGNAPPTVTLTPGQDIVPGWRLTLDTTPKGYWFAITDTADPCGFAFVSNEVGKILKAEVIR